MVGADDVVFLHRGDDAVLHVKVMHRAGAGPGVGVGAELSREALTPLLGHGGAVGTRGVLLYQQRAVTLTGRQG